MSAIYFHVFDSLMYCKYFKGSDQSWIAQDKSDLKLSWGLTKNTTPPQATHGYLMGQEESLVPNIRAFVLNHQDLKKDKKFKNLSKTVIFWSTFLLDLKQNPSRDTHFPVMEGIHSTKPIKTKNNIIHF